MKTASLLKQAVVFWVLAFWIVVAGISGVNAKALYLNGIALHQELGEPYYYGTLSVEKTSQEPSLLLLSKQARRMNIKIAAKRITPRRFTKLWNESIAINNSQTVLRTYQTEIQAFLTMIKSDLIEGDDLVVDAIDDNNPVHISLNEVSLLSIDSPEFFNVLLRCWIGEVPLTRQFRRDILGVDQNRLTGLIAQFKELHPKPERTEEINRWISADQSSRRLLSTSTQQLVAPLMEMDVAEPDRTQLRTTIQDENEYYYAAVDWASRHSSYPRKAIEQSLEGVVRIRVTVDREGNVLAIKMLQRTDHVLLNDAAQRSIQKATPFPPIPAAVRGETYSFTVPFRYQIDR